MHLFYEKDRIYHTVDQINQKNSDCLITAFNQKCNKDARPGARLKILQTLLEAGI